MRGVHRQTWIALSCCFVAAMAILLLLPETPAEQPRIEPPVTRGSATPELPVVEAATAGYTGNIKTHKFHRLSCRYASCTNCRVKFATREEAVAAGFTPCGTCEP